MHKQYSAIFMAVLAAALYALNSPLSKLLLAEMPPAMMASLLYLGAGGGMLLMGLFRRRAGHASNGEPLTTRSLPYVLAMIALDVLAPIFLMIGLKHTTAANAALLNSFEIVATSLIALLLFGEAISKRLWGAIALITISSILLSVEGADSLRFSSGSVFVLLACCCWGLENNCTRALSESDPLHIVVIKGLGSGMGSLAVALLAGERIAASGYIPLVLLLGFVAYGLSIYFYVYAQRTLGAARTSAYYAVQPFIGAFLSLLIFRTVPGLRFFVALLLMGWGTYLVTADQMES